MKAKKLPWYKRWFTWVPKTLETARGIMETAIVVLYIVTGVATFLILFDLVEDNSVVNKFIGAFAFAFAIFAFLAYTHRGVKHQLNSKKEG